MKIFKKNEAGFQPQTKIQKRVATISTPDLVAWTENALFTIGKNVTGWQRNPSEDYLLEEADLGAEALYAITQELKRRAK